MKKIYLLLLLGSLLCLTTQTQAQVKSLSELKGNTPYLLRNINGFGYCIYNSKIDDKNPTLGETIVDHASGCVNDQYHDAIDPRDPNNQWYIESNGNGAYLLRNVGKNIYISNETNSGGWWGGWGRSYGTWFFTETEVPISIEKWDNGGWMFRTSNAAQDNSNTAYLCAASHSNTAIANWTPEDYGSTWEILSVEDDIKLYHQDLAGEGDGDDVNPDDDNQQGLGEVPVEGDIRYFVFRDSQLIVIPEQFILDRQEDEQFLTLQLTGDTTITLSKYALLEETTEAPEDLPVMESFKFNNKFNDQLYTDAEGVINNETDSINIAVSSIGKHLTASIKLPDEEDQRGTKVWVEGRRNISKETRRRFDRDYTYTVARPREYVYKVKKVKEEVWSTPPEDTEAPWILTPVNLTADMISTNWPSTASDQKLEFSIDGNPETYFHSNWSNTNDWSDGAYYGDGKTTWPYLQIEMAESLEHFQFNYITRNWDSNQGYSPQGFIIMASKNGKVWAEITTIGKDELPVGPGVSYSSPVISLGAAYRYIRLQLTATTRKNYLVLAEFSMNSATPNPDYGKVVEDFVPELLSPAEYASTFEPYGRNYKVHVDFPSDISTSEYRVPRIDIWFGDSTNWSSKMWIGRYGKEFFESAAIQIDGAGVYPDMPRTAMQIRGRGNSSWSGNWSSKNPYRIKFADKVKPFGMTKGKSWVLLANKQSNSMTTNAIAMKIADMVESDGCNHIIPVELYINNQYRGSYNFTEKVGLSNNSIDLEDDSHAAMVELDSYYDETYKFRDQTYNLYVNIKEPDLILMPDDSAKAIFDQVRDAFNNFTSSVMSGYYASSNSSSSPLDVQGFVRAWLVTDLTRNTEIQHPKSWNVYTTDYTDYRGTWHFGPVWDFDWSYGYEGSSTYFQRDAEKDILSYGNVGTPFFRQLVQGSEVVQKEYYRLWTHFINNGQLDELINYCDDYFAFVEPSLEHNATIHSDGKNYANTTENAKNWLAKRANYIYSHLTVYDLKEDIIDEWEDWGKPDGELDAEKPSENEEQDGIRINMAQLDKPMDIYTISGQKVGNLRPSEVNRHNLHPGIYIINGQKVVVK